MNPPDYDAMKFARSFSQAALEAERLGLVQGEFTDLKIGDRVFLLTVSGEYPATVRRDWRLSPMDDSAPLVKVELDSRPAWPVEFHRTLFRAFTVLDHIASI